MSEQNFNFDRINAQLLKSIQALSLLSQYVSVFVESGKQEDLDNITYLLTQSQENLDLSKNYIETLVKEVAGIQTEEVVVKETEKGLEY